MSKRAAIAKAAGFESNERQAEHPLLAKSTVVNLAKHIAGAIASASSGKTARPSRSGCAQLALQILVVAAGLRRAALVDAVGLNIQQASAISLKLASIGQQAGASDGEDLGQVRLLFHAPTSQTFVVSRRKSLWTDVAALSDADGTDQDGKDPVRWIDARYTPAHASPTLSSPDSHVSRLLASIRKAILEDNGHDVLVVSQTPANQASEMASDAQLAGVALAGFLLEYGAVYCIHDSASLGIASQSEYDVRSLHALLEAPTEPAFLASPPNCLGSQPLALFKVSWSDEAGSSFELLSFSIPQCLITEDDIEQRRASLLSVFQDRGEIVSPKSIFARGSMTVRVSCVTLNQVAL
ncbi:hypothetical protein PSEUBRA_000572 [Kalmanozyma brasiliensis GHG001]|uniref:uncharacterized protein n=1 Tax=Kalmanozyma brasiliensis (strain GHG001) TaxID=1365824 RepID=UPI002868278B|nr:uncharacterized protein PSEUBRA_000572 [Kalmanozyma brasiliensis GHG001]KAF6766826.1 hypothetical protein PSEUBRA_000572 [Kalmanozyma brasiliensis GHG001]